MPNLFTDLLEEVRQREAVETYQLAGGKSVSKADMDKNVETVLKLMSTSGSSLGLPNIPMKEALTTADASILFPQVIDQVLVRPNEALPTISKVAKVITIGNGARSVTFPTVGAIVAGEIGETQDYPQATPAFTEFSTEIKVRKFGVMIPVSEQVIEDSMWDVLSLFVECGGNAMIRLKEENCFNELVNNSHCVFDNKLTGEALTTGTDVSGNANYTVAWVDLVDAISVLITNGYTPTDAFVHPLLWSVFAKDPILNYQILQSGNTGQFFKNVGPDSLPNTLQVPFAVTVSPYIGYTASDTVGGLTGPSTNIHIIDRNQSLVLLVKDGLSSEDFQDPYRDIRFVRIKERYGVGTLNNGKSSIVMKNIRVAPNDAPLYTIRTI